MKTLLALRHLGFEDLGLIAPILEPHGWRVQYYDLGVDELWRLDLDQVDLLAVLGGPIGAWEDIGYSLLVEELAVMRQRLESRWPLLGICRGAQLIARAMGVPLSRCVPKRSASHLST